MNKSGDFKSHLKKFLKDESGQSLMEYLLLLFFVVMAVKTVGRGLTGQISKVVEKIFTNVDSATDDLE